MATGRHRSTLANTGLAAGPVGFGLLLAVSPGGLDPAATAVLAVTLWVVTWWVTEAVPIPVTSLLPLVLLPLTGVMPIGAAAAPYADPIVFLLLGGFLLALAVERWNLHHRFSLELLGRIGAAPGRLVLGFMACTGFLSMWISNTATAMLMVPIAIAVVVEVGESGAAIDHAEIETPNDPDAVTGELVTSLASEDRRTDDALGVALLLGVAYGASVGGAATLIGSPPNAVLAGVAESSLGVDIGFLEWMLVGVPTAAVMIVLAWRGLLGLLDIGDSDRRVRPGRIETQRAALGRVTRPERRTLGVFGLVAAAWLLRPFLIQPVLPFATDAGIALAGGIALFVVPAGDGTGEALLDWRYTERLPWGVLLLLGAGFAIAGAFQTSGLDRVVAGVLGGLGVTDGLLVTLLVVAVVSLLTNVTSNTATASVFMPIVISVAAALDLAALVLMAGVAFAASFAFVLPVATAPNAIVFASGYLTIPQMARVGGWLTLVSVVVITAAVYGLVPLVWV